MSLHTPRLPELEKKMDSAKQAMSELKKPVRSSSGWRMPSQNAKTMILGTAIVGTGFWLFFSSMHRRQRIKEHQDITNPGKIPTWQHRMKQAGSPGEEDGGDKGSPRMHANLATPLPPPARGGNARHSTLADFSGTDEERRMQPTPQRGRGDGSHKVYTKAPSYLDHYEKTAEHHKRMKKGKTTRLAEDEEFEEMTG
ncbi:hypothetical protein HWV62_15911 [Athelia sp. TMB]|nr:hypothetical protein HWV62_15911 [Athelia sp. TMB]